MAIIEKDEKIYVKCGYSDAFIKKAKNIHGKWEKPYWVFDNKYKEQLNDILIDTFGESFEKIEKTEIEINLDEYINESDDLYFNNICIAHRFSRDNPVHLIDSAYVVQGSFDDRGGSAKYPSVTWEDGTIIRLIIPTSLAKDLPKGCKLVGNNLKEKLLKEKEELLKRIEEIEKQLKEAK